MRPNRTRKRQLVAPSFVRPGRKRALLCCLLRCVAELLAGRLHGNLEVLAGLFPSLVGQWHGAVPHAFALVFSRLLAAAALAGALIHALALVFFDRSAGSL